MESTARAARLEAECSPALLHHQYSTPSLAIIIYSNTNLIDEFPHVSDFSIYEENELDRSP